MSSEAVQTQRFAESSRPLSTDATSSLRVILSPLAFLIITVEGFSAHEQIRGIPALLILHSISAITLWIPQWRKTSVLQTLRRQAFWVDLVCFTGIFALGQTNHRLVFLGAFLFAIVAAGLGSGSGAVLTLAGFSVITTAAILVVSQPGNPPYELTLQLGLLLLMIAIAALVALLVYVLNLQRELKLLHEMVSLSNLKVGTERIISSMLDKLRSFYAAEACVMFISDSAPFGYRLWRVERDGAIKRLNGEAVSEHLQMQLGGLTSSRAVVYSRGWNLLPACSGSYSELEVGCDFRRTSPSQRATVEKAATIFEAKSLLRVPLFSGNKIIGQFYLASHRRRAFSPAQAKAVNQVITRIMPIIDTLQRADRVSAEASGHERTKIACDIHDSIIQPYLGIQLGLIALRRKIRRGDVYLEDDIDKLLDMTDGEIFGLRRYIAGLKGTEVNKTTLLESVHSYSQKFSQASGIAVEVSNGSEIKISDQLAEELFQIIVEGLSNIRRHTRATRAVVSIACDAKYCDLEISDHGSSEHRDHGFMPRSIMNRTRVLGGQVQVQRSNSGGTAISIKIPI